MLIITTKKYMTSAGYDLLKKELEKITESLREVAHALSIAREKGDFSENGELEAARSEKERLEGRKTLLESYSNAKVVKPPKSTNFASIGLRVCIKCLSDASRSCEYIIVGEGEQSIEKGSIALSTNFCQAFLGYPINFEFTYLNNQYVIDSITRPTEDELLASIQV